MGSDYLEKIARYNFRKAAITPHKCALLVIDMQNYFRSITLKITKNLLSIIEACRSRGMDIVFTRHGHRDLSRDGGMLAEWWGDGIVYGSDEWELLPEMAPKEGDLLIDKERYSAFFNTGLDETLRSRGIEELIVTGVMTNCCCETTARDGFVRDYRVYFVSDATAAANDDFHLSSLKNLAYGFAHILNTEEICRQVMPGKKGE